ncbi:MAG TPA: hypothetical protein VFY36_09410 [Solirubrobacteraceae bacterium]|nr:hypothetical protein [Solirubrobacteraceae bacterium]
MAGWSAIVPVTTQATEGPFYVVGSMLLLAGEVNSIKVANQVTSYVLKITTAKVKVICSILTLKANATIYGSTGAHPGTGKEIMEYEGCEGGGVGEGLANCMPQSGKFSTAALSSTLGYASASRSAPVLTLYKPEAGSTLATIKFTGTECVASSTTVTGTIVGKVSPEGHTTGKVTISFAESQPTIFTEDGGSLKSVKPSIKAFGNAATFTGETQFGLAALMIGWGVFL